MRKTLSFFFVLLTEATTLTLGWAFSLSSPTSGARTQAIAIAIAIAENGLQRSAPLFLANSGDGEDVEVDPKTKLAMDLQRLFDIDQMAYTVMVREENKGVDGKLTPDELIAAIQKDGMFGEDLEEYCEKYASEGDVEILDIGKFSEDMESSEPLPDDANLTIPGKGNYLVYLSFAEGIRATMRVVVD